MWRNLSRRSVPRSASSVAVDGRRRSSCHGGAAAKSHVSGGMARGAGGAAALLLAVFAASGLANQLEDIPHNE